jgi:hypothetical protein
MFAWFIQWTAQLNQTNHIGFAMVTVLTMVTIGVGIAVVVEWILKQVSTESSGAPKHHHPSGH